MAEYRVIEGDCIEAMADMPEGSVDAIVTDPPYGLGFMGKAWDSPGGLGDMPMRRNHATNTVNTGASRQGGRQRASTDFLKRQLRDARSYQEWCEGWGRQAERVLRPGGYILAFGGTRTYHRLASGLEDAGFEVRDMVEWLYGSGFPKHESCLKPAHEPIMLGRKAAPRSEPLQIDACRIGNDSTQRTRTPDDFGLVNDDGWEPTPGVNGSSGGRWPANVLLGCTCDSVEVAPDAASSRGLISSGRGHLSACPVQLLDEQTGNVRSAGEYVKGNGVQGDKAGAASIPIDGLTSATYADSGGASRFFYVAKASRAERNAGLDGFEAVERVNGNKWTDQDYRVASGERTPGRESGPRRNVHPTVKPVALMRWLCRLVTPPGGTVLDPFTGSGTTGCAAVLEDFNFIGIEREPEYVAIAEARIKHWWSQPVQMGLEAA